MLWVRVLLGGFYSHFVLLLGVLVLSISNDVLCNVRFGSLSRIVSPPDETRATGILSIGNGDDLANMVSCCPDVNLAEAFSSPSPQTISALVEHRADLLHCG